MQTYDIYTEKKVSDRQRRWVKNKASWERMSLSGVLASYDIPDDHELTPCGCFGCTGCKVCRDFREK